MNKKAVVLLILLLGIIPLGITQALISINTGFVLSDGKEGNALPKDYWGRGYSEGYDFESSSYKPGFMLGLKVTSSRERNAFISFSANYMWIQNNYKYAGSTYSTHGYTEQINGDVTAKSSHLNALLNLNFNFLKKEALDLYMVIGISNSFKLNTKLYGEENYVRNSYPGIETSYNFNDDDISWRNNAFFVGGYFGIGTHLEIFRIPIDIEFAYVPGLSNIYELPNFKSSSFFFTFSFQFFTSRKKNNSTPSGS